MHAYVEHNEGSMNKVKKEKVASREREMCDPLENVLELFPF
jgi:hypothetical protein